MLNQTFSTNELIPEGVAAGAQVLAVDDLVADEAEDGELGAVLGDVCQLRGGHGAEGELERGEGGVLRGKLPEAEADVLHLELEVPDARHSAQDHAAVVRDVKPVENRGDLGVLVLSTWDQTHFFSL